MHQHHQRRTDPQAQREQHQATVQGVAALGDVQQRRGQRCGHARAHQQPIQHTQRAGPGEAAAPALAAGWLLAFTLSLDDLVIASFVSGPGASTLPMYIFSKVKLGVTPDINALASILILIVSGATMVIVSYATEAPALERIQGLTFGTVTAEQKAETRAIYTMKEVVWSVIVVLLIIAAYLYFNG